MIASSLRRPAVASLLMAATVVAALLPPTHIHLVAEHGDHDHTAGVEHSHWSPHQASRSAFDDDDGRVLFVDHPALVQAAHEHVAVPHAAALAAIFAPAAQFNVSVRRASGNAPRDGPSRDVPHLRGPPAGSFQ